MGIKEQHDSENTGFQDAQQVAVSLSLRQIEALAECGLDSPVWNDKQLLWLKMEVFAEYAGDDTFIYEDWQRGFIAGIKSHLAEMTE